MNTQAKFEAATFKAADKLARVSRRAARDMESAVIEYEGIDGLDSPNEKLRAAMSVVDAAQDSHDRMCDVNRTARIDIVIATLNLSREEVLRRISDGEDIKDILGVDDDSIGFGVAVDPSGQVRTVRVDDDGTLDVGDPIDGDWSIPSAPSVIDGIDLSQTIEDDARNTKPVRDFDGNVE